MLMVMSGIVRVKAFELFYSYKFYYPHDITYYVSTTIGTWTSYCNEAVESWETHCPQIDVRPATDSNYNIYFYADTGVDSGFYAYMTATSENRKSVTVYAGFLTLSEIQKRETLVHEVGHAFGLLHCQELFNEISVMRATGFNNKPYPLSDDISGIAAMYPND